MANLLVRQPHLERAFEAVSMQRVFPVKSATAGHGGDDAVHALVLERHGRHHAEQEMIQSFRCGRGACGIAITEIARTRHGELMHVNGRVGRRDKFQIRFLAVGRDEVVEYGHVFRQALECQPHFAFETAEAFERHLEFRSALGVLGLELANGGSSSAFLGGQFADARGGGGVGFLNGLGGTHLGINFRHAFFQPLYLGAVIFQTAFGIAGDVVMRGGQGELEIRLGRRRGGEAIGEGESTAGPKPVTHAHGIGAGLGRGEGKQGVGLTGGAVVVGGELFAFGVVNAEAGIQRTAQ